MALFQSMFPAISSNRMMSYGVTLQGLMFRKYAVASFLAS